MSYAARVRARSDSDVPVQMEALSLYVNYSPWEQAASVYVIQTDALDGVK